MTNEEIANDIIREFNLKEAVTNWVDEYIPDVLLEIMGFDVANAIKHCDGDHEEVDRHIWEQLIDCMAEEIKKHI